MRRLISVLLSLGLIASTTIGALAQAGVEVTEVQVTYTFGEHITFIARFQPPSAIQEIHLFFQAEGGGNTHTVPIALSSDGQAEYRKEIQTLDWIIRAA